MLDLDLIFGHPRKTDVRRVDTLGEEDPYAGWLEVVNSDGTVGLVHPDHVDDEVIDIPAPCAVCGGIVFWWDMLGRQHCERCEPRTTAERLQEWRSGCGNDTRRASQKKTIGGLLTASQYADTMSIG